MGKLLDNCKEKLDSVYSERNKCIAALAVMAMEIGHPVFIAKHPKEDKEWEDDWRNILVILLPTGQITWHLHDSEMVNFYSVPIKGVRDYQDDYVYDGHTTEEKYKRLLEYTPLALG